MEALKEKLRSEIPTFLKLGQEYQEKKISMMEFKHKSGGMGVYAQRGGEKFMIRLRLLCGVLDVEQLKLVYEFAKKYQLERLHFTTRQTIQLHDMDIIEVCELMEAALDHDIYTRGGGGNYPRNVSLSPLSGVSTDEVFDVTPFAILVNEHFLEDITNYHLPRKLKVSFSNSAQDTGRATINDLGFMAVEQDGKPYFKLYLCGGCGNHPLISTEYDKLIRPEDVLYYVDGMVKFYMQEGNYENRAKARTRYIAMRMSKEELLEKYTACVEEVKQGKKLKEISATLSPKSKHIPNCECQEACIPQRQEGKYTIVIHPTGGQLAMDDCKALIEFLEGKEGIELRLSMDESMYVRNLSMEDAKQLLELTKHYNYQYPVFCSVACIGVPTCQIGICQSQKVMRSIVDALQKQGKGLQYLPVLQISGCNNSCSRHQVAALGFAGRKVKVDGQMADAFEVYAGGKVGLGETHFGQSYGVILADQIPEFVAALATKLEEAGTEFEQYYHKEEFQDLVTSYKVKES